STADCGRSCGLEVALDLADEILERPFRYAVEDQELTEIGADLLHTSQRLPQPLRGLRECRCQPIDLIEQMRARFLRRHADTASRPRISRSATSGRTNSMLSA